MTVMTAKVERQNEDESGVGEDRIPSRNSGGSTSTASKSRPQSALHVDPELWRQAKIVAIERGWTLTELVEIALKREISKNEISRN